MISVILYGRNDNHGYNYHKRLAISLNCIASVLSDPNDEIIFVDYNTPNELPTITEAIQDTLTSKAKSIIRTLRVRPSLHARFAKQSSLPLLEPIARNVALRRSRPDNKWILSTNIDMIFVTENQRDTLTSIVSQLKDGFYCLPRLEIPETLWELSLERSQPEKNIVFLRENSRKLHLNTVIRRDGFLQYDNPGDFQLMPRKDLFDIGGFDEQMLKGWHVDANLCKRMSLLYKIRTLDPQIRCYHCNHTQQETFLHSKNSTQNDWHRFVGKSLLSPILKQENWGLEDETLEEITLDSSRISSHVNATITALGEEQKKDYSLLIHPDTYNQLYYCPSRVFTYLIDHLCNLPKETNLSYIGYNVALIQLLVSYLTGTERKLLCLKEYINKETQLPQAVILSDMSEIIAQGSVFIFDFGIDENSLFRKSFIHSNEGYQKGRKKIKKVMHDFLNIVKKIKPTDKCIGIHLKHSDFNLVFSKHLSIHLNSHATGISYGYKLQKNPKKSTKFLPNLQKRQLLMHCGYYVTRYLFNYSDHVRKFVFKWIR
jgi:hypothetical protein